MKLLTIHASTPGRPLFPKTALGKWLWIIGCIVVLVPLVMVGLLLTAAAIVAVLAMGLAALVIVAVRRIGHKPVTHIAGWTRGDGRRNVRVVQRTNLDG